MSDFLPPGYTQSPTGENFNWSSNGTAITKWGRKVERPSKALLKKLEHILSQVPKEERDFCLAHWKVRELGWTKQRAEACIYKLTQKYKLGGA